MKYHKKSKSLKLAILLTPLACIYMDLRNSSFLIIASETVMNRQKSIVSADYLQPILTRRA